MNKMRSFYIIKLVFYSMYQIHFLYNFTLFYFCKINIEITIPKLFSGGVCSLHLYDEF